MDNERLTEKEIISLALYAASVRKSNPGMANHLERLLYDNMIDYYPESELTYVLELTEPRIYQ